MIEPAVGRTRAMDGPRLHWLGARYGVVSAAVGCGLFAVVDLLRTAGGAAGEFLYIAGFYAGFILPLELLFALPLAAVGGFGLGWLFEQGVWRKRSRLQAGLAGVAVAALAITAISAVVGSLQICFVGHITCRESFVAQIQQLKQGVLSSAALFIIQHYLTALPIAMAAGAWTAERLGRAATSEVIGP